MNRPGPWWICATLTLCATSGAAAQLPGIPAGGRFLSDDDSLGYEQFRQLSADEQRDARGRALVWLSCSKDELALWRGSRPKLPWRKLDRGVWQLQSPITSEVLDATIEKALDCAATAVGCCPYMAEAWIQYADVAEVLGYDETAVACSQHARKTIAYENDAEVRKRNLVQLERVSAISSYNAGRFPDALESARFVIKQTIGEWVMRLIAARSLNHLGRFEEARRTILVFPDDRDDHAKALHVLGVAELGLGKYQAADRVFDQAALEGLIDPVFENDRGRLCIATGEYRTAVRHFLRATELAPDFHEAACNVGVAQKRNGDLEAAEATFTSVLEAAPEYAPAHFNLAEVYRTRAAGSSGDARTIAARRALTEYNLALKFGESADMVIERRATLSAFLSELSPVEDDLLSLAGDPGVSVHVLTVLARVKKDQGRLDIAEQILEMATQREDGDALAYAELGEVRLRRQNPSSARPALERACVLDPGLVIARINLSIACDLLGDRTAAWTALDEAIAIDPLNPLVLERVRHQTHRK